MARNVRLIVLYSAMFALAGEAQAAPRVEGVLAGAADPAVISPHGGRDGYYVFATGPGCTIWHSRDLVQWRRLGRVFDAAVPDWAAKAVPRARGIWAPDISYFDGLYHLYYSVSSFGSQRSVIGLAVNKTLDPKDKAYRWVDRGIVIESKPGKDNFNAIDAALFVDADDKAYLFWGSYWTGIKVLPIDRATGKPIKGATPLPIAARAKGHPSGAIEAPYVIRRDGWYTLFVSWDFCLGGARSTYKVMVGRSKNVTGPYLDFQGKAMTEGGGTLVLATHARWAGPGHNSVLQTRSGDYLVHHTFDLTRLRAHRVLQIRPMYWPKTGWPVVGEPYRPAPAGARLAKSGLVGSWAHRVDYGQAGRIELRGDGVIADAGVKKGSWTLNGSTLTLTWPDTRAPRGAWIDRLFLEPTGRSYVGRNQNGQIIQGTKTPMPRN